MMHTDREIQIRATSSQRDYVNHVRQDNFEMLDSYPLVLFRLTLDKYLHGTHFFFLPLMYLDEIMNRCLSKRRDCSHVIIHSILQAKQTRL